jgi:hypothetical protein
MFAARPTQIARRHVLIVTEQKRIGDIGIAKRRKTVGKSETRIAALQAIWPVRAGNVQCVQPVVFINVYVLRTQALAREADVTVKQQGRRDRIGSAKRRALNASR